MFKVDIGQRLNSKCCLYKDFDSNIYIIMSRCPFTGLGYVFFMTPFFNFFKQRESGKRWQVIDPKYLIKYDILLIWPNNLL